MTLDSEVSNSSFNYGPELEAFVKSEENRAIGNLVLDRSFSELKEVLSKVSKGFEDPETVVAVFHFAYEGMVA